MIDIQKLNSTTGSSSVIHSTTTTTTAVTTNTNAIQCYAYFLESKNVLDTIRKEFGTGFVDVPLGDWKQYLATR